MHLKSLLTSLCISDPDPLWIDPQRTPRQVPCFTLPESYPGDTEAWLRECESQSRGVRNSLTRQLPDGVVLAEYSSFRIGHDDYQETRTSNVWLDGAIPETPDKVIPSDFTSYDGRYQSAASDEVAIGCRHFATMEFHGSHHNWVTVNANAALYLGLSPDSSKLFGWANGEDSIWTIRWIDGDPLIHPRQTYQGDGWLIIGSSSIGKRLIQQFSDVRRHCSVKRKHGEGDNTREAVAGWSEPFNAS